MPQELVALFHDQGRVATAEQILAAVTKRTLQRYLRNGEVVRIHPGIYSLAKPDDLTRLRGLDLRCGEPVAVCLHTAAKAFRFGTERCKDLHVLNPAGNRLRDAPGLVVHRRGAPLTTLRGRPLTTPAWTAVEVARTLERPRALATLDAALRSRTCDAGQLSAAATAQAGRRGVVMVRDLIPLARPGAESPMESEARLVMLEGGLPEPALQYTIVDRDGRAWRVDFAWPAQMLIVEYDGFESHSSPAALRRDRQLRAALEEVGWRVMGVVADDVRNRPARMVRRIDTQLNRAA